MFDNTIRTPFIIAFSISVESSRFFVFLNNFFFCVLFLFCNEVDDGKYRVNVCAFIELCIAENKRKNEKKEKKREKSSLPGNEKKNRPSMK